MQLKAVFVKSSKAFAELPPPDYPEFAFIGRSNVGKSSLINMLTAVKGLAKTSSTPGKTRLINHFLVNDSWYLADLPGYGFAKVGHEERAVFARMIDSYLEKRDNLMSLLLLIDIRHEPQQLDLDFIEKLAQMGLPFALVFTKADKLSRTQQELALTVYKTKLQESWEQLPPVFVTSATSREGRDALLGYIETTGATFKKA